MNYNETAPNECPHCGETNNAWTSNEGHDVPNPEAGAVSICVQCAGLCIYIDGTSMRKATLDEVARLEKDPMVVRSRKILSYTDSPVLASSLLTMDMPEVMQ